MDSVSNVGVVDKAVAVLRALERAGPSGLAELHGRDRAATSDRPPPADARSSSTGWCAATRDGRFCLGLALVGLGQAAADGFPLADLARPGAHRAPRRDRRERAAVRPRGRRPALRRVAAVAPRSALDRARGCRCCRCTSARPAGCCPASSVPTAGSRASRSASPAWRRSARRCSTPAGGSLAAVSVSGPVERLSRATGRAVRRGRDLRPPATCDRCGILGRGTSRKSRRPAPRSVVETIAPDGERRCARWAPSDRSARTRTRCRSPRAATTCWRRSATTRSSSWPARPGRARARSCRSCASSSAAASTV